MIKGRYYATKNYLDGDEAASYLQELTGVKLLRDELFSCIGEELGAYIILYSAPDLYFSGRVRGLHTNHIKITEVQRLRSHWHLFQEGREYRFIFNGGGEVDYVELEGEYTSAGFHEKFMGTEYARWELQERELISASSLLFKTSEVKILAAKINDHNRALGHQKKSALSQNEAKQLQANNAAPSTEASAAAEDNLTFTHTTEGLRLVARVQQTFYNPDRFDIHDPDSYPTKRQIIDKLLEWGVDSHATAEAVERVATPFSRNRAKK